MTSGPPPTRYRVVERGRRLEVIDTWAGNRPPAGSPASAKPGLSPAPVRDSRPMLAPATPDRPQPTRTVLEAAPPARAEHRATGGTGGYVWIWLIVVWVFVSIIFPLFWALPLVLLDPRARKLVAAINQRGRNDG